MMKAGKRLPRLVVLTLATLGACASPDGPTSPFGPAMTVAEPGALFNIQLRTVPGFAVLAWGHLQVRLTPVDPCVPPNPVVPDGQTLVAVCGRIFNEGGAIYGGGGLYTVPISFDELPVLVASFNTVAAPVDPCRRYDLGGYILLPDETANQLLAQPSRYQVLFDAADASGTETQLGGLLDGSAWGPVGARPEQDPFFGARVCSINVQP